jgi:hypothetical protein
MVIPPLLLGSTLVSLTCREIGDPDGWLSSVAAESLGYHGNQGIY